MRKLLAFLTLLMPAAGFAQAPAESAVTFRFVAAADMFYIPWSGNGAELERLCALVDEYRTEIDSGTMPVYVDGYCASLPTPKENLHTAFVRANRVKSELITRKGLKEADFITKNYATACEGNKDLVVVTLRIPRKAEEPKRAEPVEAEPKQPDPVLEAPAQVEPEPQPVTKATPQPAAEPADAWRDPYCFAVRTNVLYDALLLPTLGVEWRINRNVGVKLDGSLSWWSGSEGKVQKVWLLNPEVRWYLLRDKRFYAGVAGDYGQYNIYKYVLGRIVSKDTGYQGTMWSAGVTVGYQLPLSRRFAVDFNLGLGYTKLHYDTFNMIEGVRVNKDRDQSRNFWGPTQAGISLIWKLGGNK